jgi:hypothetical protein
MMHSPFKDFHIIYQPPYSQYRVILCLTALTLLLSTLENGFAMLQHLITLQLTDYATTYVLTSITQFRVLMYANRVIIAVKHVSVYRINSVLRVMQIESLIIYHIL